MQLETLSLRRDWQRQKRFGVWQGELGGCFSIIRVRISEDFEGFWMQDRIWLMQLGIMLRSWFQLLVGGLLRRRFQNGLYYYYFMSSFFYLLDFYLTLTYFYYHFDPLDRFYYFCSEILGEHGSLIEFQPRYWQVGLRNMGQYYYYILIMLFC